MPNFLCFTDPSLASGNNASESSGYTTNAEDSEDKSSPSVVDSIADKSSLDDKHHGPTINSGQHLKTAAVLFKRDENSKKRPSSFSLQRPYALAAEVQVWHKRSSNEEMGPIESTHDEHYDERCDHSIQNDDDVDLTSYSALVATAQITSSSLPASDTRETSPDNRHRLETFLFGGFELVANVRIVEVCIVRSENNGTSNNRTSGNSSKSSSEGEEDGDESYLATCQGIPVLNNDLAPLEVVPPYTDGTIPQLSSKGAAACSDDKYYMFSYILPGGPKPMKKVTLKFVSMLVSESSDHYNQESVIIVRTLNVKGRLKGRRSDSRTVQESNHSATSTQQHEQSTPIQHVAQAIRSGNLPLQSEALQNGVKDNAAVHNNIAHIAALQQQIRKLQEDQLEQAKQLPSELHMRKQSEILSKIPGVNLFIRPFEELTTSKAEKMFEDMEKRIMGRLDGIVDRLEGIEERLDGIEQSLKESSMTSVVEDDSSTKEQHNNADIIAVGT